MPSSVVVAGANCHDKTLALQTIDEMLALWPEKRVCRMPHLCLAKGYDDDAGITGVLERDYNLRVEKRGINGELPISKGEETLDDTLGCQTHERLAQQTPPPADSMGAQVRATPGDGPSRVYGDHLRVIAAA